MNRLSLYIHIPFCVQKCHYCDFLSAPCEEEVKQEYIDALCIEIKQRSKWYKDRIIDTIFLGGGTPSILSAQQLGKVMTVIKQEFHVLSHAEISMEVNPGTVDREKLEAYRNYGVNRLSIGLQSGDNEELKILGRIHTWETFVHTWDLVRELGFSNVNIDLMSALPGQTLESYENSLKKVLALRPEHISAYSLIIEEGTRFYEWFREEEQKRKTVEEGSVQMQEKLQKDSSESCYKEFAIKKLPDEMTERQMYEMTGKILEEHGYDRYEISNYALRGYECKHNVGYWKRKEYLGLGLGAASLLANVRSTNVSELTEYLEVGQKAKSMTTGDPEEKILEPDGSCMLQQKGITGWTAEWEELSEQEQMEEFMFLGLRMMEGIRTQDFEKQFGKTMQKVYGTPISKLEEQGLLKFDKKEGRYALTLRGIDVSNRVFVEFIE